MSQHSAAASRSCLNHTPWKRCVPKERRGRKEIKGTCKNGHFRSLPHKWHWVKNKWKHPPNSVLERHSKKGTVPSLKLISFLRLPVYPLQIPKPPSVILTNEAIKFRVANSFELHLLSKSFNIPTTVSPSLSRLFGMLGSLLTRDHQLTLFCHLFPERGKKARQREMGREIPPAWFLFRRKFPKCLQKGISALDAVAPIPLPQPVLSNLPSPPACVFRRLSLDQVDPDPISISHHLIAYMFFCHEMMSLLIQYTSLVP